MIIRGRDTVEETTVENIHGGKGKCHAKRLLGVEPLLDVPGFPGDFDSCMEFMHEETLEPGAAIGIHPQEGNEELYFVIKGRGLMTIDGETQEMGPGDVSLTKSGSTHGLENIGDSPLKIIVVQASIPE